MNKRKSGCTSASALAVRKARRAVSLLTVILLIAAGGSAWAQSNPSTCTKTGPALLLTELRDLDHDGVGETPIQGSKIDGETIYYQASLFVSTATGQCAYEGGTLCIDTPGASGCVDVTPAAGIPLLCDNDVACNPDGVAAIDSKQISYVVNHLDFEVGGLCDQQVRAVAQYRNGTSHFGNGVFPVNADTPICNPVLFCGDSIIGNTPGETCDPPGQPGGANGNTCRGNCTVCGDNHLDAGEQCDDGNTNNTDGCTNTCELPKCGDGILGNTPGETCEPPGTPAGAHNNPCRGDCTVCGDSVVNDGEQCDDGNTNNTDTCANNCTITARCGDSIVGNTPGETCDPPGTPAGANGNTCRGNCTVCGDGHLDSGEDCDDGNSNNTDTCANDCTVPPRCGDGILGNTPGETCEPPGSVPEGGDNTCRNNCTYCGDNHLDAGEGCDDGNQADGDGCSSSCTPEASAICRTPGFWGTHAYANPKKKGSQNITQAVIDAGGGCLNVCGETITDTFKNSADSAIEAICISIKGDSRLQLARQLTAAALNCVITGGGSDCAGTPLYSQVYGTCNALCADSASSQSDVTSCIGQLDCLNNGGIPLANGICQKGVCAGNQEPCSGSCSDASECLPLPGNCHSQPLVNPDLGLSFDPPGPAGSEGLCSDANGNACKVLQPGEMKCSSGNISSSPETCQ